MIEPNQPYTTGEKLLRAYDRMLERVQQAFSETDKNAFPRLHHAIEKAEELTAELGELTEEEARKIGTYIRRDIEDAANYLAGPEGDEFADWLRFDIEQVEERILEAFFSVADQTKVDLLRLSQGDILPSAYQTGEITGIGTLECTVCSKHYHFRKTDHIPRCECGNTAFVRWLDMED